MYCNGRFSKPWSRASQVKEFSVQPTPTTSTTTRCPSTSSATGQPRVTRLEQRMSIMETDMLDIKRAQDKIDKNILAPGEIPPGVHPPTSDATTSGPTISPFTSDPAAAYVFQAKDIVVLSGDSGSDEVGEDYETGSGSETKEEDASD
ncbi:unnamed protein product [Ilex paraguariensis]|uniref:Uncharacterized protein n=1 Tax=Ilex paraguariensis TaxID=185542 RepID=A0ABC8T7F1_9AQUA